MKILLINKYHYLKGGAERCYFDTAKLLQEAGHEVAFFSMKGDENVSTKWSKYFIDRIDYDDLPTIKSKIKASLSLVYNFSAKRRLKRLIKDFKPDVAHLHNIYHQLSPSIIDALRREGVPMAMTLHDYKLICPNYKMLVRGKVWEKSKPDRYYRCFLDKCFKDSYFKSLLVTLEAYLHNKIFKTYDKVDVFISPSRFLKKKFKEFGFANKIEYLPNPFFARNKADTKRSKEGDFILYFGRLSQEKGVGALIRAFSNLDTDLKLKIAGVGDKEKALKKEAKKLDKVDLLGFCKDEKLDNLIKKAVFIVVPSRWYENAPYSVVEAMGAGKVVLCSDLGGLPELVQDGYSGFIFRAFSEQDLEDKMRYIIDKRGSLDKIGRRASQEVKRKNDPDIYLKKLEKIYTNLKNS